MKLLWVMENYHPYVGGVETLFKTLEEQLLARGHELVVLTSRSVKGAPPREERPGFTLIRLPMRSRYLFTFFAWPWVWYHARKADLVHTTTYNAALPAWLGAWLARKKIVLTFHEVWDRLWFRLPFISPLTRRLHHAFEQLLLHLPFHRFVGVSHFTAQALKDQGIAPDRVRMIYNGIAYPEFEVSERGSTDGEAAFTYTFFGRLGISKGLDLLLAAAPILRERIPGSQLQLIVPKQPQGRYRWVKKTCAKSDLKGHVRLRHHLSFEELKAAIRQSDCVVIPSYSEGFCFAAVETMALGTPLVSSDRGALAEVVGGKVIAMREQSAEALAEAVEQAAAGKWEERPAKRFELAEQVEAYLRLYEEIRSIGG
jgi:glycosyltransferase involved in cell wall biosynthesis